jgi:DNA-directed RNA polymerase specialized sigma subunit
VAPPEEGLDARELGGWVQSALGCLSGLQAKVLTIRFGFGGEEHTRTQAARALGLTSGEVARLEREGLQGVLRSLGPQRDQEIRRWLGVAEVCA